MKVAILVFSPSGNTLKVAKMLEDKMIENNIQVQLIDTTRKDIFTSKDKMREFLKDNVKEHDLICIGGPVYAHHMHYNLLDLIKVLPQPDNEWGGLALPFVTYGSFSSGVALYEAGKLLRRTGRKNILGFKIEAFHSMSRILSTKVNVNMPGAECEPFIDDIINRIRALDLSSKATNTDVLSDLNYQVFKNKIKANLIFRERFWQNHLYPKLIVNGEKCVSCKKCVDACPVQRLIIEGNKLIINKNNPACIHCGECINTCNLGALDFNKDRSKWNKMFKKASEGRGPLPSNEFPKSEIYPLNKK